MEVQISDQNKLTSRVNVLNSYINMLVVNILNIDWPVNACYFLFMSQHIEMFKNYLFRILRAQWLTRHRVLQWPLRKCDFFFVGHSSTYRIYPREQNNLLRKPFSKSDELYVNQVWYKQRFGQSPHGSCMLTLDSNMCSYSEEIWNLYTGDTERDV
jgi:hypothetical protein